MRRLIGGLVLAALGLVIVAPAWAAPAPQGATASGAVVALRGTPHLWIADEQGVLHWSGDTRALSGKPVDWGNKREDGLDELRAMRRADPWLSAGLVKVGDPIYFVKWEADAARPTLQRIQSISDVELFGINGSNYGALVLERGPWEQRFGFGVDGLPKGDLAPATASTAGTRENPLPRGTPGEMGDGWRIVVTATTPNANVAVATANSFNKPAAGRQFYIVTVSVTRTAPTSARFDRFQLSAVGPSNVGYVSFTDSCGVIPNPLPNNEVFSGGTVSGNVCWSIAGSDTGALLMYRSTGFGQNAQRLYFAL